MSSFLLNFWNTLGMEKIREATDADFDSVLGIWASCDLIKPQNDPRTDFDLALNTSTSTILILECENQIVGAVMIGFDGHRGWLYYFGVKPAFQSLGNGRILLSAGEEWLANRGSPKAMLMVRNSNSKVIGFYERLGYGIEETSVLGKRL